jgi:hypothetical protein
MCFCAATLVVMIVGEGEREKEMIGDERILFKNFNINSRSSAMPVNAADA